MSYENSSISNSIIVDSDSDVDDEQRDMYKSSFKRLLKIESFHSSNKYQKN